MKSDETAQKIVKKLSPRGKLMLDDLFNLVLQYDTWRLLGHRRRCFLLVEERAKIVEAILLQQKMNPELCRKYRYLQRCPICAKTIKETVEMFKSLGRLAD